MNALTKKSTNACRSRKFSDAKLVKLHSGGLSIPKLAKELGVSQQPLRKRLCKLGLKANGKRGGVPRYEKVGSKEFRCVTCRNVKPLRQRHGRVCLICTHDKYVSTEAGALRFRFDMKRISARRRGIPFELTFEQFERLHKLQTGIDAYSKEPMAFEYGHGRSGETMSLDRIDNDKGYIRGNVAFCKVAKNGEKNDKPPDQYVKQLRLNFPDSIANAILEGSVPCVPGKGTGNMAA